MVYPIVAIGVSPYYFDHSRYSIKLMTISKSKTAVLRWHTLKIVCTVIGRSKAYNYAATLASQHHVPVYGEVNKGEKLDELDFLSLHKQGLLNYLKLDIDATFIELQKDNK